jgi:hypothetical protein
MKPVLDRWARRAGLTAGLVASVVAVAGWRTPPAHGELGLDLAMTYQPDPSLEVKPAGRVLSGTAMKPGESVEGQLSARNITGVPLALRVRALPSIADLDRSLVVHLDADGRSIYNGPLGSLRTATAAPVRLASGATSRLHVRAELPGGAGGWQGRIEKIVLELR